jgi:phosphoribosyl-ATP pyrophosphohydrolase
MKKSRILNQRKPIAPRQRAFRIGEALPPYIRDGITIAAAPPAITVDATVLEALRGALDHVTADNHPRTFKLLQSGRRKLARKVIEEACEVTVEAVKRDAGGVVRESADLLYHLVVLWFHVGIEPAAIWQEMQARADALGIAEKLPKASALDAFANDPDC